MAKPGKAQKSAARSARLSAALRDNLKKRKEQARARVEARAHDRDTGEASPAGSALPGQGPDFRRNHGIN